MGICPKIKNIEKFINDHQLEYDDGQPTVLETYSTMMEFYENRSDKSKKPDYRHMLRIFNYLPEVKIRPGDDENTIKEKRQIRKDRAIIALLHDMVEDGMVNFDDLRKMGYSKLVVECLQRIKSPNYPEGITPNQKQEIYEEHVQHNMHASREIATRIVPPKFGDQVDNVGNARTKYIGIGLEAFLKKENLDINQKMKEKTYNKYKKTLPQLYEECKKYVQPDEWSTASRNIIRKALSAIDCELVI